MIETLLARQLRQAAAAQRQQADTFDAMAAELEQRTAGAAAPAAQLLSIDEFCAVVKLCPDTARDLCASGAIRGAFQRSARGRWLIPHASMVEYLRRLTKQPEAPALKLAGSARQK